MSENRESSKQLAELLDSRFRIPYTNIRFGIDSLIGLIPGAGDWIAGAISFYLLIQAAMKGGRSAVLGRMFVNILVDVLLGSIPVLGDIFDVYWKANLRNAKILDELQQNPAKTTTESQFWIWIVVIQFLALIIAILLLITWLVAGVISWLF